MQDYQPFEMFLVQIEIRCKYKIDTKILKTVALPGVAQQIEHQPANQRVTDSTPSQCTCLGCRPGPQ